jgi:hypothetical protein
MILGNLPWRNFGTYHARVMALTSLVVCAEDEAGDMLSRVLQDLDIEVQISSDARRQWLPLVLGALMRSWSTGRKKPLGSL